jgi:hypothetical protein
MTQMLPEFNETDIERQQHHHTGGDTEEEKQVIEALLGPSHINRLLAIL